jgi:hypothetical protein
MPGDSKYDIFEILPDGSPLWKGFVAGRDAALQVLEALAAKCSHELRVITHSDERSSRQESSPIAKLSLVREQYTRHYISSLSSRLRD